MSSWQERISPEAVSAALKAAWVTGTASKDDPIVFFHDLQLMDRRINEVIDAFPNETLHAIAVKANPVIGVLRRCVELGAGLEAASWGEVELALAAGCAPRNVVLDSPVKTGEELRKALKLGLTVNADNAQELARIDQLPKHPDCRIGLRVNPVVGAGSIEATSVAARGSKFGLPIFPDPGPVAELFGRYSWLKGIHVHVGSQGCGLELLSKGVARTWAFAESVGVDCFFDVGGGVPTAYSDDADSYSPVEYWRRLEAEAFPDGCRVPLITEFGRAIQAGCGWAAARVEYVKREDEIRTALMHLGGDGMPRTVYMPETWVHELLVLNANGEPKQGATEPWNVGGPLCFNGDFVAKQRHLPAIESGDWIIIRDAGAYTLSLWSRFCSRNSPSLVGYRGEESQILRHRESTEELIRFWS
jgi:diaminopimelate decarboxylase